LDVVIASLHWRTWNGFQGPDQSPEDSKKKILNSYLATATNPQVDILGHPTVFPEEVRGMFSGADFKPILAKMKQTGVAMEINLSVDLSQPEYGLERDLIRVAGKVQVPVAIAADVHHLADYQLPGVFSNYITSDNWQQAFDFHRQSGWHFNLFRYMAKNIRLMQGLGIRPEQVINSSYDRFSKWFSGRRS
jgi:hypothetical protein